MSLVNQQLVSDAIKVIQLTDTHVFSDDQKFYYPGIRSNQTFDAVLQRIQQNDLADTQCIFLTGDVSQDETKESYQYIVDRLTMLNLPVYWVPGNHDNVSAMTEVFAQSKLFFRIPRLSLPHWEFIFLNTQLVGDTTGIGYVSAVEMKVLDDALAQIGETNKSIAVVLHHHLTEVGTPFIDRLMVQNRAEVLQKLMAARVKLVIHGHVHGDYRVIRDEIVFESAPATCAQLKKGITEFAVEKKIGYKTYCFTSRGYDSVTSLWENN